MDILSFVINSVLPAILPTILFKKFIVNPLIENKLIHDWCDICDEINIYLKANVSKNHPRIKELKRKEEEAYQKLVEFSPYIKIR